MARKTVGHESMPGTVARRSGHVRARAAALRWALACAVALSVFVAPVRAAAVVPLEGPWHATLSNGLPLAFEVVGGQVVGLRFGLDAGFCGTWSLDAESSVPIEPEGGWRYLDPRGPEVKASFVSPGRAEGVLWSPSRMTPSCPHSRATFVARPGDVAYPTVRAAVPAGVGSKRLVSEPSRVALNRSGTIRLYDLRWRGFGEAGASASGRAYLRARGIVRHPRVTVRLSHRFEESPYDIWEVADFEFHGPLPPGVARRGRIFL
jgi:hypothetical protein